MKALINGTLVDPQGGEAGVRAASLLWDGDEVRALAPPGKADGAGEVLDANGGIVLPGLVCGHVELSRSLLPGLPAWRDETEPERARRYLDNLDDEALVASVRLAAMEAALAGVTVVFDLWRGGMVEGSLDLIAAAVEEVGLRAVLGIDVDDSRGTAREAIRENTRFHRSVDSGGRFRGSMPISDPDSIEASLVAACAEARKAEMIGHLVLGGSVDSRRRMAEAGAMRPGTLAVVAAELDAEERALLRDLRTWTVTSPRADASRAIPPPPLEGVLARTALGGWESSADPLADRSAAFHARAPNGSFRPSTAWGLLARGWDLAAETFDLPFGRYAAGAPVDFVVFDAPMPAPLSTVTLGAHLRRLDRSHVRHVVCAGDVVVQDGVPARVDEAEVRAGAREQLRRTWAVASLRK